MHAFGWCGFDSPLSQDRVPQHVVGLRESSECRRVSALVGVYRERHPAVRPARIDRVATATQRTPKVQNARDIFACQPVRQVPPIWTKTAVWTMKKDEFLGLLGPAATLEDGGYTAAPSWLDGISWVTDRHSTAVPPWRKRPN